MSLKSLLKQRLLNDMIKDALSKNSKQYALLIADNVTIPIISHCFKMHELNDENIGVVVNLNNQRERVKISPIYFIDGSHDSVKKMVDDYDKDKQRPTYAAPIHVYCVRPVGTKSLDLIKNSTLFKKHLRTFTEIFCDFLVLEQRLFTFNRDLSFNKLYINKDERSDELTTIAQQLLGVLFTLNADPYFRYSGDSRLCEQLGKLLDRKWNDVQRNLTNYNKSGSQCHVILIDRSDDPITPLLHELTYQAMAMDLLHDKIDTSKPKIKTKKEEENEQESKTDDNNNNKNTGKQIRIPDERDDIWVKYRHGFIATVRSALKQDIDKWRSSSAVAQYKSKNKSKNVDLLSVAKDLPQYGEKIKKFTVNTDIASEIANIFRDLKLSDTVDLEQSIATWINTDGKKCSRTKIQEQFVTDVLQDSKKSKLLKLRVFMMYLIAQGGLSIDVRKSLMENAEFDDSANDTIFNLGNLGVVLQNKTPSTGHKNKTYWKYLQNYAIEQVQNNALRRYISFLNWALLSHVNGQLSENDFPWISKPKDTGNKTKVSRSHRRKNNNNNKQPQNNNNNNKTKILIYVLGGVSYSEIRSCYELSNSNTDVYIGSTSILSPQKYLQLLSVKPNKN